LKIICAQKTKMSKLLKDSTLKTDILSTTQKVFKTFNPGIARGKYCLL